MNKVIYIGSTDEQVRFGSCDDPRGILEIGGAYIVDSTEIHSFHTKLVLAGIQGKFNSVCFEQQPSEAE